MSFRRYPFGRHCIESGFEGAWSQRLRLRWHDGLRDKADNGRSPDCLPRSVRNPRDQIATEAVAKPVEDFFSPIAHDFAEPYAAVHSHKQRPVMQARRLGMSRDVWVDQVIPNPQDFRL